LPAINEKDLPQSFKKKKKKKQCSACNFLTMLIFALAAHNGKRGLIFLPFFVAAACFINQPTIPKFFKLQGKKPWNNAFGLHMELWNSGDYKNFTSLHLLAGQSFDIPQRLKMTLVRNPGFSDS